MTEGRFRKSKQKVKGFGTEIYWESKGNKETCGARTEETRAEWQERR